MEACAIPPGRVEPQALTDMQGGGVLGLAHPSWRVGKDLDVAAASESLAPPLLLFFSSCLHLFRHPACSWHHAAHEHDHQRCKFPANDKYQHKRRDARDISLGAAE